MREASILLKLRQLLGALAAVLLACGLPGLVLPGCESLLLPPQPEAGIAGGEEGPADIPGLVDCDDMAADPPLDLDGDGLRDLDVIGSYDTSPCLALVKLDEGAASTACFDRPVEDCPLDEPCGFTSGVPTKYGYVAC